MRIKTTGHVNARTLDGRVYAAGEGTVSEFDDDDEGMIGLAKSLIVSGQAEHYGDAGDVADEDDDATDDADASGSETADEAPAEDDKSLTDLRAQAEAADVKVDGRWGPDRLREEIAAAQEAGE